MWESIQYVGTPLSLVAFIVAAIAYTYRAHLKHKVQLIQSASEQERAQIIREAIETYSLKDDNLTREQKFNLVRTVIQERAKRFKIVAVTSVVIALILAAVIIILAIVSRSGKKSSRGEETAAGTVVPRQSGSGDTKLETQTHEGAGGVGGKVNTVSYTGRVRDDKTNNPVQKAKVSIEEDQKVPQVQETDSDGIFHVNLLETSNEVRIIVEAAGYNPLERRVSVARTGIEDIRLQPTVTVQPVPKASPRKTRSRPKGVKPTPQRQAGGGKCNAEDILFGRCKLG